MYSIEMNYRNGNKTTKKPIGKICAICDRPRHQTSFWSEFSSRRQILKRQKENQKGAKATPRTTSKTICSKCQSTNVKFRKLNVHPKDTQSYHVVCRNCGYDWIQAWKNYADLEKLGWVQKRVIR